MIIDHFNQGPEGSTISVNRCIRFKNLWNGIKHTWKTNTWKEVGNFQENKL